MPAYILIHNPRRPNEPGIRENPDREIAHNICDGKRALTAFGGWSVEANQRNIKPQDRLLFYRSGAGSTGFFAVGRTLPSDDCECCDLRKAGLRKWHPDNPAADNLVGLIPGLAAYKALGWDKGKEMTTHINAEWEIVVDPKKGPGRVLYPCNINNIGIGRGRKPSGCRLPDEIADKIVAKCAASRNRLQE